LEETNKRHGRRLKLYESTVKIDNRVFNGNSKAGAFNAARTVYILIRDLLYHR